MQAIRSVLRVAILVASSAQLACIEDPIAIEYVSDAEGVEPGGCDGREVGEMWDPDPCNFCLCTEWGVVCSEDECVDEAPESPECGGYDLGEMWEPDECNLCWCSTEGPLCTRRECYPGCNGHTLWETWMVGECACTCNPKLGVVCDDPDCYH